MLSYNLIKPGSPDLFGQADAVVKHVLEGHDRYTSSLACFFVLALFKVYSAAKHLLDLVLVSNMFSHQGGELGQFPPKHAADHQWG